MSGLNSFTDFLLATRDVRATPGDKLFIEPIKNSYILDLVTKNSGMKKYMQGGTKIVDRIIFKTNGNFGPYNPGQELNPTQSENKISIEVPWSFNEANTSVTEETVVLNSGDTKAYFDYKASLETELSVDVFNSLDSQLMALPDYSAMEATAITSNARKPYSIPAFVTRDGLEPTSANGGLATGSSTWTTTEQVSRATNEHWRNKVDTYDSATPSAIDTGIVSAFDRIHRRVQFNMPNALQKWSDPGQDRIGKNIIFTSLEGATMYEAALRALNDRSAQYNDPGIGTIQYRGIPVQYISAADDLGWTAGEPDYFFINFNELYPIFHKDWYMRIEPRSGDLRNPLKTVVYCFVFYNLFCRSLSRQGRVSAA